MGDAQCSGSIVLSWTLGETASSEAVKYTSHCHVKMAFLLLPPINMHSYWYNRCFFFSLLFSTGKFSGVVGGFELSSSCLILSWNCLLQLIVLLKQYSCAFSTTELVFFKLVFSEKVDAWLLMFPVLMRFLVNDLIWTVVSLKSKAAPTFCGHAFSWDFYSGTSWFLLLLHVSVVMSYTLGKLLFCILCNSVNTDLCVF